MNHSHVAWFTHILILKVLRLQSCLLSEAETAEAEIMVRPVFEPDYPVSFSKRDVAIMAGYRAAADPIPALKAKIAAWQPGLSDQGYLNRYHIP